MSNVLDVALPKWPALIVVGNSVNTEQAEEILIRTSGLYCYTNDKEYSDQLASIFNLEIKKYGQPEYKSLMRQRERFRILDLEYLVNERICSCWVGGPYGWCDWDGTIGCLNHNIGKWPDVKTVLNEWRLIARTFPYLNLRCQLLDKEACFEDGKPLVEYVVANGKVEVKLPTELLAQSVSSELRDDEIGISIDKLRKIVKRIYG